jgi:hypothetical protein
MDERSPAGVAANPARQYELLLEDTARITDRRHNTNTLYLSANSLLLGGTALLAQRSGGADGLSLFLVVVIAGAGLLLCHDWRLIVLGYQRMIRLRFGMLEELEADPAVGPIRIFVTQREQMAKILGRHAKGGFSGIEAQVPRIFQSTYVLIVCAVLVVMVANNWSPIHAWIMSRGVPLFH